MLIKSFMLFQIIGTHIDDRVRFKKNFKAFEVKFILSSYIIKLECMLSL